MLKITFVDWAESAFIAKTTVSSISMVVLDAILVRSPLLANYYHYLYILMPAVSVRYAVHVGGEGSY